LFDCHSQATFDFGLFGLVRQILEYVGIRLVIELQRDARRVRAVVAFLRRFFASDVLNPPFPAMLACPSF
jgi:hypothetical protein